MKGRRMLYLDCLTGERIFASSVAELCLRAGYARGSARRMYRDAPDHPVHVGYVLGRRWFEAFIPYRGAA